MDKGKLDKPAYKDIFNLNLKYIEYLLAKTSLTHDYMRNIDVTGSEIEQEVRQMLRNILPQRFHVTHGYIISAASQKAEPLISPQVDVIIVDTLVPHSLFIIDQHSSMEAVPLESVVGIFEIKRKLDKRSLLGTKKEDGALKHLRNIYEAVGMRKDDPRTYFPGGVEILSNGVDAGRVYSGGCFSNPIIGVISVNHVEDLPDKLEKWKRESLADLGLIDLLFSINGYLLCTGSPETNDKAKRSIASIHTEQAPGPWQQTYQPGNDNRSGSRIRTYRAKMEEPEPFVTYTHPPCERVEIVAKGLGFIVGYIMETGGRNVDINNYFFNGALV